MKQLFLTIVICYTCSVVSCQENDKAKPGKEKKADKEISFRDLKNTSIPKFAIDAFGGIDPDDADKLDALNIKEFSNAMPAGARVQPNAKVVGYEDTARGTDISPAIMAAMKTATKGQFIIIGPGEWVVSTPIDLPASKQINLVCMGNLHFNKRDGFRITAPKGTDPQHHLFFYGSLIGAENLPRHTRATTQAGTQPQWQKMTNTAVDITNSSKNFILINRAEGFGNAVRINGGHGLGSEQNTISFQFFYRNANGITLRSIDGNSYVDHNKFMGFYGGTGRISGGLAINIDGFEGAGPNGEPYNGAFRSNEFHFLVAQVDGIVVANGDVTEPVFDITIEAGDNTGVYGPSPIRLRSVPPNIVRSPKFCGSGIFNTKWLTNGLGVNGVIMGVPVYYDNHTLIGTDGKTDNKGNIILESRGPLSKSVKDGLPKNIKIVNESIKN